MLHAVKLVYNMQVITQPVFATVENLIKKGFGKNLFIHTELSVRIAGVTLAKLTLFKLFWRTLYVCLTTCKQSCFFCTCCTVAATLFAKKICIAHGTCQCMNPKLHVCSTILHKYYMYEHSAANECAAAVHMHACTVHLIRVFNKPYGV